MVLLFPRKGSMGRAGGCEASGKRRLFNPTAPRLKSTSWGLINTCFSCLPIPKQETIQQSRRVGGRAFAPFSGAPLVCPDGQLTLSLGRVTVRLLICCLSSAVYKHFTLITPSVSRVLLSQEPNRLPLLISFIFVTVPDERVGT